MSKDYEKQLNGVILPVVEDTGAGRELRVSYMELKTYTSPGTSKKLHLLSSRHIEEMKKLPF